MYVLFEKLVVLLKFMIHFSVIALLLSTLHHSYQQPTPLLTLEEGHDVHLLKKVEKKIALLPYLKVSLILIVLLVKETWLFRFLHFLSTFCRRFFNPVFYQANYIASLTH